jgi:hypothetical protein
VPISRGYSAGRFSLELEGEPQGFLFSVEGGECFANAVREPVAAGSLFATKHPGPPQFAPVIITFGIGVGASLFQWITDLLAGNAKPKSGAISFLDYNYKEQSRLTFRNAVITAVEFPALAGSSKDAARISLTLQPDSTQRSTESSGTTISAISSKSKIKWNASNFRLKIVGLETACARVSAIDAVVVTASTAKDRNFVVQSLEIPNLSFRIADTVSKDFFDWFDDFVLEGDAKQERDGTLEYLDPTLKNSLFTLSFNNLGILAVRAERAETGSEVVAQSRVECYCERMSFTNAKDVVGVVDDGAGASSTSTTAPTISTPILSLDASLTDSLLGIISGRIRGEDATRAALALVRSPEIATPSPEAQAEIVARRLQSTVQAVDPAPAVPRRAEGTSLGEAWATASATLDELQSIAAADTGDWTSLRLDVDHSLISALRAAGLVAPTENGPIELDRSDFVEGIVAGAADVLRNATPHLS